MRSARLFGVASVGLMMAVCGCYSPYQNSPYGAPNGASPYGAPFQSAPTQTLTPGGTYTPGGTFSPGGLQPTPSYNSGSFNPGTPTEGFNQSIPTPSTFQPPASSGGSNAPYFEPGSNSGATIDRGVPQPFDPGDEAQLSPQPNDPVAEDDMSIDVFGAIDGAGPTTENVAKINTVKAEFLAPIRRAQSEALPNFEPTPFVVVDSDPQAPSPYAHDADEYRWIRGVARRNESTGVWSLMYAVNQTDVDPYTGWLTLVADPLLSQLSANGTYLIHGKLDRLQTDAAGKPSYRVESVSPWQSTANTTAG